MPPTLDPRSSRWLAGTLEPLAGHPDCWIGLQTEAMARVWRAAKPERGRGWEKRAVQGEGAIGFWLDEADAEREAKPRGELLLGFPFAWEGMDVVYVDRPGDEDLATELFAAGHAAVFTRGGRLFIKADEVGVYLDLDDPQTRELQ